MSLKYVLAERVGLKLQRQKWLEKHARLASILITTFSTLATLPHREPSRTALSVRHLHSGGVKTGFGEMQIKASFPCKFMEEASGGGEKERGGERRGSDGGWKWSGDSVLCECLCAALAKKNKARATLGSDFSMEAWQETGSSGGGLHFMSSQTEEKEI